MWNTLKIFLRKYPIIVRKGKLNSACLFEFDFVIDYLSVPYGINLLNLSVNVGNFFKEMLKNCLVFFVVVV